MRIKKGINLSEYGAIYKGLIWYTQRVFLKAIFDTLMIKQATKQKLLPVGYGNSSILKKIIEKDLILLDLLKKNPKKVPE